MRIAVIADVHANLPALRAVIDDVTAIGCDAVWCAGDVVGRGPHHNEVVEEMNTMLPRRFAAISSFASRLVKNHGPRRFAPKTRSKVCSSMSKNRSSVEIPTLLTISSGGPNRSRIFRRTD